MKINDMEVLGKLFAYDGCHKIYIIENSDDKQEALKIGYDVLPISNLKEIFYSSCPLKFISNWSLDKSYVNQFENAVFE